MSDDPRRDADLAAARSAALVGGTEEDMEAGVAVTEQRLDESTAAAVPATGGAGGKKGGSSGSGGSRGLGAKASRGAATMIAGQLVRVIVQTGGLILLARVLTPKDFGLATMVTAIIGIGEILRDFGLSLAAMQARDVTRQERDNLFWANTAIGGVLSVVTLAASPLIAAIYGDPRLQAVSAALAVTFLLNGMTAQYRATLQRELQFFKVNVSEIAGVAAGLVVGVVTAVAGASYWAIVWQQIVTAVVTLLLAVISSRWLPRWYHRGTSIRRFLKFGINVLIAQAISYAAKNTDSVTIGIRFGPVPLGLYNRAFQLLALPLNQLNAPSTRVATPILARLQDDRQRYADFIVTGQTVLLHAVMAVVAAMGALAVPGIDLVLGSQWTGSAPLFQILAIAGSFQTAGYVSYWVFLSKGLTRSNLLQSLVSRPVVVICIIVGSHWGVTGVAWGYTAGAFFNWPFSLWWVSRVSDAPVARLWWNGLRCWCAYVAAALAAWAVVDHLSSRPDLVQIAAGLGALVVAMLLVVAVWPAFRRDLRLIRSAAALLR